MDNKKQIQEIETKFTEELDNLYKSSREEAYSIFLSVASLNTIHKSITGESLFNNSNSIKNNDLNLYEYLCEKVDIKNNYIKKITDFNLEELKKSKLLINPNRILSKYIIENLESKKILESIFIKIEEELQEELITGFLDSINPKYKNIYLNLKERNRIILLNKPFDNYNGSTYSNPNINKIEDNFIFINSFSNDFYKLVVLSHELGHLIENIELKKKLSQQQYIDYQLTSPYGEINSMSYSLKFIKYLENIGLQEHEIKTLRSKEVLLYIGNINNIILYLKNPNNFINENSDVNIFQSLKYSYGAIMSMYLDSIKDSNQLKETETLLAHEKILNNDLEIFEKIGCMQEKSTESTKLYVKKCL